MFYYFFKNKQVIELSFQVHPADKRYELLTAEQQAFYIEHPNAKIHEIRNCKIDDPIPPTPIDIEQFKKGTIDEISKKSLGTMAGICSPYQFANAQASLIAIEGGSTPIYDEEIAHYYLSLYIEYGKRCRDLFYEAKAEIELCETAEGIESIKNNYFDRYDHITDIKTN